MPIVAPFVFVAIVLFKILQVSEGSVVTALAVAGLSGPTQIIEGIAILGLLRMADDNLDFTGISRSWFWIGFLVIVSVLSDYLPWYVTAFVLLATLVSIFFRIWNWWRNRKGKIQEGKWSFPQDDQFSKEETG